VQLGQELALVIKNADQLATAYQQVIDRYNFTYLDFDIEGAALGDISSIDLRNQALVLVKKKNPKVKISYTLPVLPFGLTVHGVNVLASAVKAGLVVDRINLMTMNYVNF
jgi:chitinase